jgi:ankyrin repeat protein
LVKYIASLISNPYQKRLRTRDFISGTVPLFKRRFEVYRRYSVHIAAILVIFSIELNKPLSAHATPTFGVELILIPFFLLVLTIAFGNLLKFFFAGWVANSTRAVSKMGLAAIGVFEIILFYYFWSAYGSIFCGWTLEALIAFSETSAIEFFRHETFYWFFWLSATYCVFTVIPHYMLLRKAGGGSTGLFRKVSAAIAMSVIPVIPFSLVVDSLLPYEYEKPPRQSRADSTIVRKGHRSELSLNQMLLLATTTNQPHLAQILLKHGANVDVRNSYDKTPLMIASEGGYVDLVKIFLKEGGDRYAVENQNFQTVLRMAKNPKIKALLDPDGSLQKVEYLYDKIDWGDLAGARTLISQGADINRVTGDRTPLMYAVSTRASRGRPSMVELLLDNGADPNVANHIGRTALHKAGRSADMIQLLVDKGADVNAKDNRGRTPLLWTCNRRFKANPRSIARLLDSGANVNDRDLQGKTPLMELSEGGHVEGVKLLLERGAEINAKDSRGQAPLMLAWLRGHVKVIDVLLEKGAEALATQQYTEDPLLSIDYWQPEYVQEDYSIFFDEDIPDLPRNRRRGGELTLHKAAYLNNIRYAKMLFDLGAGANTVNRREGDSTPLLNAVQGNGGKEMITMLIKNGADPNYKTEKYEPPLVTAFQKDDIELAKLLLENGADPNITDRLNYFLWHNAAVKGKTDFFELLIKYGADKRPDWLGRRALDAGPQALKLILEHSIDISGASTDEPLLAHAIRYNTIDHARILLDHGADPNCQDVDQNPVLIWATRNKKSAIIDLLIRYGANLNGVNKYQRTALMYAAESRDTERVRYFLKLGADLGLRDDGGDTAFFIACRREKFEVIKFLLESGSDINNLQKDGATPLIWASGLGKIDLVKLLLESGADVRIKGWRGQTALYNAACSGRQEIVKILLDYGSDINIRAEGGETALMNVVGYNKPIDMVELLLDNGADVNIPDDEGRTPLMMAVNQKRKKTTELLLERGADVKARDKSGRNIFRFVDNPEDEKVLKSILNRMGAIDR